MTSLVMGEVRAFRKSGPFELIAMEVLLSDPWMRSTIILVEN